MDYERDTVNICTCFLFTRKLDGVLLVEDKMVQPLSGRMMVNESDRKSGITGPANPTPWATDMMNVLRKITGFKNVTTYDLEWIGTNETPETYGSPKIRQHFFAGFLPEGFVPSEGQIIGLTALAEGEKYGTITGLVSNANCFLPSSGLYLYHMARASAALALRLDDHCTGCAMKACLNCTRKRQENHAPSWLLDRYEPDFG